MTPQEANIYVSQHIDKINLEDDTITITVSNEWLEVVGKALEIADRVSQIDYMEMPIPKITETDNGVKANANILEAVEVITHNNLLAKIKGEEERIYAK